MFWYIFLLKMCWKSLKYLKMVWFLTKNVFWYIFLLKMCWKSIKYLKMVWILTGTIKKVTFPDLNIDIVFFSISCVTYPPYFFILNDKKWISLSLAQEGAPGVSSWSHLQVSAPKNHGSEKIFSCWKLKTVIFQQEMFQEHSDAHTPSNFLYFF